MVTTHKFSTLSGARSEESMKNAETQANNHYSLTSANLLYRQWGASERHQLIAFAPTFDQSRRTSERG